MLNLIQPPHHQSPYPVQFKRYQKCFLTVFTLYMYEILRLETVEGNARIIQTDMWMYSRGWVCLS